MTRCDAEPAQRDKRVASPISEPRVTGNKGFSFSALDEVCVSGTFERTGEILPAGLLDRSDLGMTHFDGFCSRRRRRRLVRRAGVIDPGYGAEHEHRRFFGKGKLEHARRRQIFSGIKPAGEFFGIQEISIPRRVVRVATIRIRNDRRYAVIRLERDTLAALLSYEFERAVFVMSGMEVTTREEGADAKLC